MLFTSLGVWAEEEVQSIVQSGYYVGPSTYYINKKIKDGESNYNINIIESLLTSPFIEVSVSDSGKVVGQESVLSQAISNSNEEKRVIGAVNGDFFYTKTLKGLPSGISIINGEVRTAHEKSDIFGVTKSGSCFIDTITMKANINYGIKNLSIKSVNRVRWNDEMVLYTPAFGDSTKTTTLCKEVIINGKLPLLANEPFVGTVRAIYEDTKDTPIGEDDIVISAHGKMAKELMDLSVGDEVTIKVGFSRNNIVHAISGTPRLIRNKVICESEFIKRSDANSRHPRTAIGIKGGKLVMVTVDGRQEGLSDGMTLLEFSEYLLSMGIENALNLDGGGSTTMVARKQGDTMSSLANSPSDGIERSISNSIQLISKAPISEGAYIKFKEDNILVYKGSSFPINFFMMDKYFNPVNTDQKIVKYITDKKVGMVKDSIFTAGKTISDGYVDILYNNVKGRLKFKVVDKVSKLDLEEVFAVLEKGEKLKLNPIAFDENGQKIYISSSSIKWSIDSKLAKIDKNGVVTALNKDGLVTIKGELGEASFERKVKIGDAPITVCDFEELESLELSSVRAKGDLALVSGVEYVKSGKNSLKLEYDLTGDEDDTSAVYMNFKEPIKLADKPLGIGISVYGDSSFHWIRGTYINGEGEKKTINFTEQGGLDWTGWKELRAMIPEDESFPIAIERIYIAEPEVNRKNIGIILLDKLDAIYMINE